MFEIKKGTIFLISIKKCCCCFQTDGLTLTPLKDKLMAIKHEAKAVDEIMDFFYKNGVHIDDSRKRNLVSLTPGFSFQSFGLCLACEETFFTNCAL